MSIGDDYDTYTKAKGVELNTIKNTLDKKTYTEARAGIANISGSCWFSATIQMLLFMPEFILSILDNPVIIQNNKIENTKIKQNVFKTFLKKQLSISLGTPEGSTLLIQPNALTHVIETCIGNKMTSGHQDAQEGLAILLNLFEPANATVDTWNYNNNNEKNFYTFKYTIIAHTGTKTEHDNIFWVDSKKLNMPLSKFINNNMAETNIETLECNNLGLITNIIYANCSSKLQDYIKKLKNNNTCYRIEQNIMKEINDYITSSIKEKINILNEKYLKTYYIIKQDNGTNNCSLNYSSIATVITNLNKYFIVNLKLFIEDTEANTIEYKKITHIHPIEYKLFIENEIYILSGIIAHSGTLSGGHYHFYKIISENKYIVYNDDNVTSYTNEDFLNFTTQKKFISMGTENNAFTPYVLLYERDDSNNNDITFNLTFDDVFGDH